jgi:uncharacterized membrane protein
MATLSTRGQPAQQPPSGPHNQKLTHFQVTASSFQGPIPPPDVLAGYETLLPGSANRILSMAESQTRHRQNLETKVTDHDIRNAERGLYAAFGIGIVGIVSGSIVEAIVRNGAGAAIAGLYLVSIVTAFIYGTSSRKRERLEKAKIMTGQQEPKTK